MRRERSMDSGNTSGSMSSSGGDEEYDSRPDSLQTFLNPSAHFGTSLSSNPQSSLFHHHHHQQPQQPTLFDPSPNLFHSFSPQNPNVNSSLPTHLDVVRSGRVRSDLNYTVDLGNTTSSSQSVMGSVHQGSVPSMQLRSSSVQDNGANNKPSSSSPSDHQTHVVTRNPKKRTRASRRAPTTVLTTDTSNFRAMVQEFTGIPSPPFSGASPYSRRLDLFGAGSAMGSLYPLRPSAQKVHQQSPFLSSSLVQEASNIATTSVSNSNNTSSITPTTSNFSNPSSINYPQPQTFLNMQHQLLPFQSLLQPSLTVPGLTKPQPGLALPSLDELGMSHGNLSASLGGLRNESGWRSSDGIGSNELGLIRPGFDGNFSNSQRVNNSGNSSSGGTCKLNYAGGGASSEFQHHDHRPAVLDNVSSRGEGATVDSWICHEINEAK